MTSTKSQNLLKSNPQITLRWATRSDLPSITRILVKNLLTFELHDHFVPTRAQHPIEYHSFLLHRVKLFFVKPETRYMVAEASYPSLEGIQQTEIVGFATWEALGEENPVGRCWMGSREAEGWMGKVEARMVRFEAEYYYRYFLNRIVDYTALETCMTTLHSAYESVDWLQTCLHLQFLMVEPAWQRGFGVGRKLLEWGINVAEEKGLPIVLESSLVGYEFYLKCGFRLLERVRIDVVVEKAYDAPVVVYEPGRKGR